jgi:hypothetical protein
MDSRNLNTCRKCGHDWHPVGGLGCSVVWMGERCGCGARGIVAELFGNAWTIGPSETFATITEARSWAESYGTTADSCAIYRAGRLVGRHVRDTAGNGMRWYRATI